MADIETFVISSNGKAVIKKDPDATLDYFFDWTDYLALIGDTILTATIVLTTPASATNPLTKVSQSTTTTTVRVFVSGGLLGATESITCRITTAGGRVDDRTVYLKMVTK